MNTEAFRKYGQGHATPEERTFRGGSDENPKEFAKVGPDISAKMQLQTSRNASLHIHRTLAIRF
jgi:hypothetical protein